ncbi:MAG: molybdopterin biosynthesis protein [Methanosarcinaceae archaeon]|nr:molybdopterin biosynthesis protein [Methanosarcinaceae archaeon]
MENKMERKEFRELVQVEEARRIINGLPATPSQKTTGLENAFGKVLAEDIVTEINVPPFSRSIMDGYAVRAEDTYACSETNPAGLRLIGEIAAGSGKKYKVSAGEAVEIATGAPIPDGADSVVKVEDTALDTGRDSEGNTGNDSENGQVLIYHPVTIGENIMKTGSDLLKGERVLRKGRKLGAREIGVLASIGKEELLILDFPVGIISTGDELVRPGESLSFGQIYDANSYTLQAGVEECGTEARLYGIVGDDKAAMKKLLEAAASECSLILTSGSTSAGAGDVMYRLIGEMGEMLAHGINIKPGKPVVIGVIQGVPIIGLPGNPTSALMIFNEFVAPFLRKALGTGSELKKTEGGVMGTPFRSEGRQQLLPVGLVRGKVYPADRGSGAITSLAGADGFMEIPPETEFIEAGTPVEVTLFGDVQKPDLLVSGGSCPGLDLLEDLSGLSLRVLSTGSSGGFSSVSAGTADLAGVNMPSIVGGKEEKKGREEEKGKGEEKEGEGKEGGGKEGEGKEGGRKEGEGKEGGGKEGEGEKKGEGEKRENRILYNGPTIEGMGLSAVVLVKGYRRDQGLILPPESEISELGDLVGKRFINRNRGSGTRALLDLKLAEIATEKGLSRRELTDLIQGYSSGAKSEVAVCDPVKEGKADAGVGLRACAEKAGLKFVKFAEEDFDFLIRKEVLDTPEGQKFLKTLSSKEFAAGLPEGMRVYERTGERIEY